MIIAPFSYKTKETIQYLRQENLWKLGKILSTI